MTRSPADASPASPSVTPATRATRVKPDDLHRCVVGCIEALGTGFLAHPGNTQLREQTASGSLDAPDFCRQLTCITFRMLVLAIAEEQGLIESPDADAGVMTHLRQLMTARGAADAGDLWPAVRPTVAAMATCSEPAPDLLTTPSLALGNDALLKAVCRLSTIDAGGDATLLDLRSVRPEDLGSAYEALLVLSPEVDPHTPALKLRARESRDRKVTGSFYTPAHVVERLLDAALDPVVEERLRRAAPCKSAQERALLATTVCDPAMGTGNFLTAAARRLAQRLAHIRAHGAVPTPEVALQSLRDVIRHCIYGVDLNPMAAELCRLGLWLEAAQAGLALSFLDDRIKVGNSLLGATPGAMARGIPDEAFRRQEGDQPGVVALYRRRNRSERTAPRDERATCAQCDPHQARLAADAWCAAFVWVKRDPDADGPPDAITDATYRQVEADAPSTPHWMRREIERLAREHRFFHWTLEFPGVLGNTAPADPRGFDVVIGNPPFLNQLESETAASRGLAGVLHANTDGAVSGYTDLAGAFLLQATRMCRPAGRVTLILPQSILAARDARAIRAGVLDDASLVGLWVSNERVFEGTSVFTCAPTLQRGAPRIGPVARSHGAAFEPLAGVHIDNDELAREETWAHLAAAALGVPEFAYSATGTIGDLATATADFRDQYYGLDGFLIEDTDAPRGAPSHADHDYPPIVTTGLIDLAACYWGAKPTRILKRRWTAPRIDRQKMRTDGDLSGWIDARLVPKVILATQTRVIEAFVDDCARFVPGLPLITLVPLGQTDLWHIAAALASPVCTAIAMQRYAGTALTIQAIKLSARQALGLPAPSEPSAWAEAARHFERAQQAGDADQRRAALLAYARASIASYGVADPDASALFDWWRHRSGLGADRLVESRP